MRINVEMLQPGFIVRKPVFAKAIDPLIPAGVEITAQHIDFLKAFLIDTIDVEAHTSKGERVQAQRIKSEPKDSSLYTQKDEISVPKNTDERYQAAVQHYTQAFKSWQSGTAIDISSFRKVMIPLLDDALQNPQWLARFLISGVPCRSRADQNITVGLLTAFLAKKMGESSGDVIQLGLIAMLADSGLSKLSPSLLDREGNFIGPEASLYERHVSDSYNLVKNSPAFKEEIVVALTQHHEYEDGSGYPLRLTGNQINTYGKYLIACVNLVQQMVKENKQGGIIPALDWLSFHAFKKLPKVVFKKLEMELMTLLIGASVNLSNGQKGRITFIMDECPTRPMISLENNQVIALSMNRSIKIVSTN
ncbi:MAG: HD domain-containing phosphohydrolase [Sporolactobacillus sp.]